MYGEDDEEGHVMVTLQHDVDRCAVLPIGRDDTCLAAPARHRRTGGSTPPALYHWYAGQASSDVWRVPPRFLCTPTETQPPWSPRAGDEALSLSVLHEEASPTPTTQDSPLPTTCSPVRPSRPRRQRRPRSTAFPDETTPMVVVPSPDARPPRVSRARGRGRGGGKSGSNSASATAKRVRRAKPSLHTR